MRGTSLPAFVHIYFFTYVTLSLEKDGCCCSSLFGLYVLVEVQRVYNNNKPHAMDCNYKMLRIRAV